MNFSILSPLALAVALLVIPHTASAYCRTRTCEFSNDVDCQDDLANCSTVGMPATWGSGCISYAIQSEGSVLQNISANDVGNLVRDGFQVWTDADCGDGNTPNLNGVDRGDIDCSAVEFNCEETADNNNIVMFRDGPSDLPFTTIALSTIIANLATGEILDVDIEINSYRFSFDEAEDNSTDLAVVVNHELGHLLGLSHSREIGALMRPAYGADSLLGTDDEAAICASYPISEVDPACEDILPLADDAACSGSFTDCKGTITMTTSGCSFRGIPGGSNPEETSPWWSSLLLLGGAIGAARRHGASRSFTSGSLGSVQRG